MGKIKYVYVIEDMVAEDKGPIFTANNDAVAMRMFEDTLKALPNKSDFRLICIGTYLPEEMLLCSSAPKTVEVNNE